MKMIVNITPYIKNYHTILLKSTRVIKKMSTSSQGNLQIRAHATAPLATPEVGRHHSDALIDAPAAQEIPGRSPFLSARKGLKG